MTNSANEPATSASPPPKGRVPRPERERQIIERATGVFARHGFEAASMEEIARESGVDRALVYQYFGGKQQLYEACYTSALNAMTEHVGTAIASVAELGEIGEEAMLDERARRGIRAFFEFVQDHGDAWDVIFGVGWSALGMSNEQSVANVDIASWTEQLLAASYPGADRTMLRARSAQLLGASWAISLWWRKDGTLSLDEVTEQHKTFCESVLGSLKPE